MCPGPHWGGLQHSPDPVAGIRGPYFEGEVEKREGKGVAWKGDGPP